MDQNYATQLIVGASAFTVLSQEWDSLAGQGMTDTPFQSLAYQRAWWTHLHPADAELVTVAVRHPDSSLAAIGCFYLRDETLYFNGCVEETDYLDLITRSEDAAICWRAVVSCLQTSALPWSAMSLCNIPAASPTRQVLPSLVNQFNLTFSERVAEVCPIIALPDDFDTYLETLDSKQRRELNRKLRRAEAAGVTTSVVESDEDIAVAVDEFLDLLQRSTFEKRDWLNDGRRALFHEVAAAAQHAGTLQLLFTAVEGRKTAALFNFDYRDRIWVYNSGLDPALFAALSPGVVSTASAIELAIRLGRSEFDFLRGSEEYKYRFGAVDTEVYRLELGRHA